MRFWPAPGGADTAGPWSLSLQSTRTGAREKRPVRPQDPD